MHCFLCCFLLFQWSYIGGSMLLLLLVFHTHWLSSYCTGPAHGQEWVLWRRVNISQSYSGACCGESKCILIITIQGGFRDAFTFFGPFNFQSIFFFHFQLWKRFRGNDKPPAHLGPSRDYNIDMIPKVNLFLFVLL